MTYYKKFDSGLRLIVKKIEGLWSVSTGIIVGTGNNCFSPQRSAQRQSWLDL